MVDILVLNYYRDIDAPQKYDIDSLCLLYWSVWPETLCGVFFFPTGFCVLGMHPLSNS